MVFESRNLGPSASNSACGSTKNMSHRAGCDLRLRSRVASTTPKTCFLVQYRHCELRNFKNHDPRNRNQEMIVSRGATRPTDCRDVPSVRISLQSLITVSFFSLSVHSPNVVSIYPPAVCTHPLPSQRLSRHQWTLTQRTEHRHSSLKQRTHFRCLCIS